MSQRLKLSLRILIGILFAPVWIPLGAFMLALFYVGYGLGAVIHFVIWGDWVW